MNAVHLNDQITFNINVKVAIHVDPMIRAEALVYTYVYKDKNDVYQVDTMDCDVNWFLNGKQTKPDGFRELYIKLYGEPDYKKLVHDVHTMAGNVAEGRIHTSAKDIIKDEL